MFHSICYTEENAMILYQKHTPPKYCCYRLATTVWLTTIVPRTRNSKNRSLLIDKVLPSMLKLLCKPWSFSKVNDNVTPPLWDLLFIWFIIAASRLVLLPRAQRFHVISEMESLLMIQTKGFIMAQHIYAVGYRLNCLDEHVFIVCLLFTITQLCELFYSSGI